MKTPLLLFAFLCLAFQSQAQFTYIFPMPGTKGHAPQTDIILKSAQLINAQSLQNEGKITLTGSVSGEHAKTIRITRDGKTIIVKPIVPFTYGESVQVQVNDKIKDLHGKRMNATTFSFIIRNKPLPVVKAPAAYHSQDDASSAQRSGRKKTLPLDSLASFTISSSSNPNDGQVFFCQQNQLDEMNTNSLPTILAQDGTVMWTRDCGRNGHDYKINPGGFITYFNYDLSAWIELDSNLTAVDTITCGNGLADRTNGHDIEWYSDNHIFLLAYDLQTIDMSQVVPGGQPDAQVKFPIIQELDENRDVIWEWRTQDHFLITDADSNTVLTNTSVDFCHTNSMERDWDGNIIISNRNMCEVTKINYATGDIMWRMGGNNNQFTFYGDNLSEHFHYQHDVRRIANGHLTMMNNGNFLPEQRSSAKEYALDEVNKEATLVWYYEHPDVNGQMVYGRSAGSVQRLPNGNTFIDWGNAPLTTTNLPNFTEVDSLKNIVWEFTFDSVVWSSFTAHKYVWDPCSRVTSSSLHSNVKFNKVVLSWAKALGAKQYELDYRINGDTIWNVLITNKAKYVFQAGTLSPSTQYYWRVKTICDNNPSIQSGFTSEASFTTLARIGVEDEAVSAITVFPNPCQSLLNFSLSNLPSSSITMSILDLQGRMLLSHQYEPAQVFKADISLLPPGMYFLKITQSTSVMQVAFVKQ